MVPSPPLICVATPCDLAAPWPFLRAAGQALAGSEVQSPGSLALRNFVKLSVVPDSSERCTATIGLDGSLASGLSALISGASHLVIFSAKILAIVAGLSLRSVTPLRLYATATGPTTIGISIALPPVQRLSAPGCWSGLSAESEPARATWPWMKELTPAPEPEPS